MTCICVERNFTCLNIPCVFSIRICYSCFRKRVLILWMYNISKTLLKNVSNPNVIDPRADTANCYIAALARIFVVFVCRTINFPGPHPHLITRSTATGKFVKSCLIFALVLRPIHFARLLFNVRYVDLPTRVCVVCT